jgi:multidrug efflux pump subunit AcrB
MKAEIDKVQNLPEKPGATWISPNSAPRNGARHHREPQRTADRSANARTAVDLRRAICRSKAVAKAELTGTNERQVWVELDPQKLEAHGLSPDMVSQALAQATATCRPGNPGWGEEFLLRTIGVFRTRAHQGRHCAQHARRRRAEGRGSRAGDRRF